MYILPFTYNKYRKRTDYVFGRETRGNFTLKFYKSLVAWHATISPFPVNESGSGPMSSGRVTKAFVTKSIYGNYLGQFMHFDFDWLSCEPSAGH